VKDKTNAGGAAVILRHSLDPGRTEDTIQFETVRKMKSAMVNMAHAAAGFDGKPAVGGSEGKK
jgi:predicted methyltransferase